QRLHTWGPNELRKGKAISPLAILAGQFRSLVVGVLIGAALVSIALGELADGVAILAIVILNALIGFFQEYRAERAVAALARLAAPRARVVRGTHAEVIAAAAVVPGDVLLLDAGDLVAADARLVEASALHTSEAPLTGESQPVEKQVEICAPETPLAERHNMVFVGTSVAGGSGRALVVATGMDTEVGHIATLLETATSDITPLQRRLDRVAHRLLWACLAIVALVFALGLLRAIPPFELFLGAVSLAVAAIPEGLPAVVTVALALGVQRMVRRHALVRRLPAVETLGCAQAICSDKTGTLTVGEMTARKVITSARIFTIIAALVGWPLPLLPIQLLWINLVTDGLPALALATDPIDPGVLTRPPRPPEAELVDWSFLQRIALTGCLTAAVALSAFAYEWYIDGSLEQARNAAFSALVIAELLRAFGARSEVQTVWQVGLFSNMRLFAIVVASFALQLAIHHLPTLQTLFRTEPISVGQCAAWIALGAVPLIALELNKILRRSRMVGKPLGDVAA
ncbi:MAG TPA: cation-translocating P-type ATPase, partial [Castellaniella sp.]|nr:cation-translocating P-type ATPase [Castellaniella sp.]